MKVCPNGGADQAVLEAMDSKQPVIVANDTFRQLLSPYETLCLFRCHNPEDMADKLIGMTNNKEKWDEVGGYFRQKVIEGHSISRLTDLLVNIFQKVEER